MTVATRIERVPATTGDGFFAHAFVPEEGGSGILVLQEIFGVGELLEAKAQLLARLGYVVEEQAGPALENSFLAMLKNPEAVSASSALALDFLARTVRS